MFIRKTKVKNKSNGNGEYYTFRIVESERIGNKVHQRTLLNLGKHFDIPSKYWSLLITRIKSLITKQKDFFDNDLKQDPSLELAAHRYANAILQKNALSIPEQNNESDYELVNVNELEVTNPRSIGLETIVYHGIEQLEILPKLSELGFNSKEQAATIGNIVGLLVAPDSERSTLKWLQTKTSLGEIIKHDYQTTSLTRLYEVTDKLFNNRANIEAHLAKKEKNLLNLDRKIILYDLTNTYFEGNSKKNSKAQTLGLVLDGDGFPINSRIFEGNVSESKTLKNMISNLDNQIDQNNCIIIMDAGISSEENIIWLKENNYRYIVVSRERHKQKPNIDSAVIKNDECNRVVVQKVMNEDFSEVRVYCHSEAKEKKEQSMTDKFSQRFEEILIQLNNNLHKKGCT